MHFGRVQSSVVFASKVVRGYPGSGENLAHMLAHPRGCPVYRGVGAADNGDGAQPTFHKGAGLASGKQRPITGASAPAGIVDHPLAAQQRQQALMDDIFEVVAVHAM